MNEFHIPFVKSLFIEHLLSTSLFWDYSGILNGEKNKSLPSKGPSAHGRNREQPNKQVNI